MNLSIFGSRTDQARSLPEEGEQSIAVFGSIEKDFSQIRLPEAWRLSGLAVFGSVKYIVPRGTEVVIRGFALFGSQNFKPSLARTHSERHAVIYLNSVAMFGSVEVIEADH